VDELRVVGRVILKRDIRICEGVDFIQMPQGRDQWQGPVVGSSGRDQW
jgi:hypothetical protein